VSTFHTHGTAACHPLTALCSWRSDLAAGIGPRGRYHVKCNACIVMVTAGWLHGITCVNMAAESLVIWPSDGLIAVSLPHPGLAMVPDVGLFVTCMHVALTCMHVPEPSLAFMSSWTAANPSICSALQWLSAHYVGMSHVGT
jgi:hypothetical protein